MRMLEIRHLTARLYMQMTLACHVTKYSGVDCDPEVTQAIASPLQLLRVTTVIEQSPHGLASPMSAQPSCTWVCMRCLLRHGRCSCPPARRKSRSSSAAAVFVVSNCGRCRCLRHLHAPKFSLSDHPGNKRGVWAVSRARDSHVGSYKTKRVVHAYRRSGNIILPGRPAPWSRGGYACG